MFGFGIGEILTIFGGGAAALVPSIIGKFFVGGGATFPILIVVGLLGAAGGWYVTKAFWNASEKAAVEMALADREVRFHTVIQTEYVFKDRVKKVYVKGEEIIRNVPVIITEKVEKACPTGLPNGYVRVHDGAARNEATSGATDTDGDPAGVTLTQAGQTVGENYRSYNVCREQVIGWNAFYTCLRKLGYEADEKDVISCIKAESNLLDRGLGTLDSR